MVQKGYPPCFPIKKNLLFGNLVRIIFDSCHTLLAFSTGLGLLTKLSKSRPRAGRGGSCWGGGPRIGSLNSGGPRIGSLNSGSLRIGSLNSGGRSSRVDKLQRIRLQPSLELSVYWDR